MSKTASRLTAANTNGVAPESTTLSLLQSKEESVKEDLDRARQKLLIANRGERLEEDQQAERFEVIEHPTLAGRAGQT